MRSNYKKLGQFIRVVDTRNIDNRQDNLLGVSTQKVFIDSVANTVGTDFRKYKIVRRHQFTYVPDTSRRGDKIGIAMLETLDQALVSQAYTVFEVKDSNLLAPEYLMMWFRRPEFDRYARFKSHGSVREIFDWQEMCDVELPVPSIEKQREIVSEYNAVNDRITLNKLLIQKLEDTAKAIYKEWFVDYEFPISKDYAEAIGKPELEGSPYRSSGGEMSYCETLDKDIPSCWNTSALCEIGAVVTGKTPSSAIGGAYDGDLQFITPTDYKNYTKLAIGSVRTLSEIGKKSLKNKILPSKSLLVTCIGSDMGKVVINLEPCITNQQINALIPHKQHSEYLYYVFDDMYEHLRNIAIGSSTIPLLNKTEFEKIEILHPAVETLDLFEARMSTLTNKIKLNKQQIHLLFDLKTLLLQRITDA